MQRWRAVGDSGYWIRQKLRQEGSSIKMGVLAASIDLFQQGQNVRTAFGSGVVASISRIDSLVYVTFANCRDLYVFRPEQVEVEEEKKSNE